MKKTNSYVKSANIVLVTIKKNLRRKRGGKKVFPFMEYVIENHTFGDYFREGIIQLSFALVRFVNDMCKHL